MANRWLGDKLKYRKSLPLDALAPGSSFNKRLGKRVGDQVQATTWRNRLPICPYGCGQEGQLKEIVLHPETKEAIGIYRDSEGLVFTAPMKMQPKPSDKKIEIGPDGEPRLVSEDN